MFAQNEILVFSPGRKQEGLERLAWIHSLMSPQPGFKEAFVAKYLGDGTRHTSADLFSGGLHAARQARQDHR